MPRPKVDNRDFVVAWTTSHTLDDVVKATGMTKSGVQGRGKYLRKKGVKLKQLRRSPGQQAILDYETVTELNQLINKYTK